MHPSAGGRAESNGVSARAVLVAFVLIGLIAPAAFYGELLHKASYLFGAGVPAMAPVALLFLLTAANPLLRRIGWRAFARRELLAIYAIVLVGAPLVTHGILGWMLPMSITQQYLARAMPAWETTFIPYVPGWFCPTDVDAVETFFQGNASVPWSLWWTPLAAWCSFLVALFLSTLCLVVLFRRQWITHERLSFPLAQVPLETVFEGGNGESRQGRLPSTWVFWIGFLISLGLTSLSRLSGMFPAIPNVPLSGVTIMQWQKTGPLAGFGAFELWLVPWMIAVAYLIPKELSFSCWFFWVVRIGLTVAAIAAGATPQRPEEWWDSSFPAATYQGGGAVLAVALWALWVGRRHLKRAVRLALRGTAEDGDTREPLSYRWALIGFVLSFGYLVYFCWLAGARVMAGTAIIGLIVVHYIVWARLRAETGLGFIPFPLTVNSMIIVPFGSGVFTPREIVTLFSTRWTYFPGFGESFEVVTGNSLEAFKVADSARIATRPLLYAMVAGLVISLVVGVYVVLTGMYHYGFFNSGASSSGWLSSQLRGVGTGIFNTLTTPSKFDLNGTIGMGAGAAVTFFLATMRLRFWWWPFHPIGYLAANCWGMHWYAQPFFIGWALKSLTIRYGGLRLFRRTMPLAIGLIVGDLVSEGLWVFVITALRSAGVEV